MIIGKILNLINDIEYSEKIEEEEKERIIAELKRILALIQMRG